MDLQDRVMVGIEVWAAVCGMVHDVFALEGAVGGELRLPFCSRCDH